MSKECGCGRCSRVKPYHKATHAATLHHLVHPGAVHQLPWKEETRECPCTSFFTQDTIPKILPYSCCFFSQQPPVICLPSSKASASQPEKESFAWGE